MKKKTLVILLGPTGVGKTALSINVAKHFDTEIISSDSRQLYKEMCIGTAVPTAEEQAAVKHHFIQTETIHEPYNASKFEDDVMLKLADMFETRDVVVMSGGSMMYIDAVCKGIDFLPTVDPKLRADLIAREEAEGLESLRMELKRLDPVHYEQVDLKNGKRVLHALEICHMTGKPYSEFRTGQIKERPFNIVKIGLNRDRTELYDRINLRVEQMVEEGLVAEAKEVYPYRELNTLNTVGYRELFEYFDEACTLDYAVDRIKCNSRKYARKQLTWFRKDERTHWFNPEQVDDVLSLLDEIVK